MSALREWLEADHRAMDTLLAQSVAQPAFDAEAFAAFRGRLLRHIGIEEKILLVAARRVRGGVPLERAEKMRRDHAAIAALLVPTPDAALVAELRVLLEPHEALEEGPGGVYEECDRLLAGELDELVAKARQYPAVPAAKHFDGPSAVRTARDAIALAAKLRFRGSS
jgi:hypothetical protein